MPRKYRRYTISVRRRESQTILSVASQKPSHRMIAKSALAIEEDKQSPIEFFKIPHHNGMLTYGCSIQFGIRDDSPTILNAR
jgi:hypothetical protein